MDMQVTDPLMHYAMLKTEYHELKMIVRYLAQLIYNNVLV